MFFFNKTSSWTGCSFSSNDPRDADAVATRNETKTIFRYRKHPQCPLEINRGKKQKELEWCGFCLHPIYSSKVWNTWKDMFLVHSCFPIISEHPCPVQLNITCWGLPKRTFTVSIFNLYSFFTKGNSFWILTTSTDFPVFRQGLNHVPYTQIPQTPNDFAKLIEVPVCWEYERIHGMIFFGSTPPNQ